MNIHPAGSFSRIQLFWAPFDKQVIEMNNPAVDRLPEQTAQCGISWEALRSGGHICGAAPFSGRLVGVFAALKCSGRSAASYRDSHSGDGRSALGRGALLRER